MDPKSVLGVVPFLASLRSFAVLPAIKEMRVSVREFPFGYLMTDKPPPPRGAVSEGDWPLYGRHWPVLTNRKLQLAEKGNTTTKHKIPML
jgi:hypothetical protein